MLSYIYANSRERFWGTGAVKTSYLAQLMTYLCILDDKVKKADKDRMKPELRHKMYQNVSAKNALINKYLKKIAEKAEIDKPLSMHISRHSFAHIAQESGVESSAIKNILGHSNLATTERYMGSFDTTKTDETLRNVFAKKKTSVAADDSNESKEEQAIELLKRTLAGADNGCNLDNQQTK